MTNAFTQAIKLRQAEPPEGRTMYPVGTGDGGGDGLNFATGNEVFQFSTNQVRGPQRPSAIMGAWVDASAMAAAAGKNIVITTPFQTFVFAAGNQGYIPVTVQPGPFTCTIKAQGGATGLLNLIFYNYNPLFTGSVATAPAAGGGGSGGGTSGGSGGSGGGFAETGGSGGGRPTF